MAEPGQRCTHPWLRVTCGVCGEAVDALGEDSPQDSEVRSPVSEPGATRERSQATFIVARGHPDLIDQLRALMGHESGVKIIEDRRQRPREEATGEELRELRKRLREDREGG